MSRLLPDLLKKRAMHEQHVESARREIEHLRSEAKMNEALIADETAMIAEIDIAIAALTPTPSADTVEQASDDHTPPTATGDWDIDMAQNAGLMMGTRLLPKPRPVVYANLSGLGVVRIDQTGKAEPVAEDQAPDQFEVPTDSAADDLYADDDGEADGILNDDVDLAIEQDRAFAEQREDGPALNEQMHDEREEGYAPVTNPEADAIARAHDYYSPEKVSERNKFNPFAMFRREPEEVS